MPLRTSSKVSLLIKFLANYHPWYNNIYNTVLLQSAGCGRWEQENCSRRLKGLSSIFVLSKKDLNETLEEYPDAKETLRNKARLLLRQDKKREKKESNTEGSLAENARLASKV